MSRSIRIMFLLVAGAAVVLLAAAREVIAQTAGRDRPGGALHRLDANGDGMLQPEEVPPRARPLLRRIAERSGVDPNGPLPIDQLTRRSDPATDAGDERTSRGERRPSKEDGGADERDSRGDGDDRGDRNDRGRGEGDDGRNPWWRWDNDDRPRQQAEALPNKVAGFGVDLGLAKVPGFDVPHSVTSQSGPSVAELEQSVDRRILWFARRILEIADENGNQIVDPAEWERLRWRGDANEADGNQDGRLTLPELIQGLEGQRAAREESRRDRGDRPGGPAERKDPPAATGPDEPDAATTPPRAEKAPDESASDGNSERGGQVERQDQRPNERTSRRSGRNSRSERDGRNERSEANRTPGWFRSRDRNGDGQVSMAEYATRWDERMVAEFQSRDPNGDGVISLGEATR